MKTKHINSGKLATIFDNFEHNFGGRLNSQTNDYELSLNDEHGTGFIKGISLKNGISYINFDVCLKEDFLISMNTINNLPMYFAYCEKGSLGHSFGEKSEQRRIKKYESGILACKKSEKNNLIFKKGESTKVSLIVVNTSTSENLDGLNLNEKLRNTFFKDDNDMYSSVFTGPYNLRIGEKIRELNAIKHTGIVRKLMTEGIINLILALEIQYRKDNLKKQFSMGSLTKSELDNIIEISTFICNYPENSYSVRDLSEKAGVSPTKLQEGFKLLHNRTVRDFITNERMKKSEELFRTTDLNVSEIVYSIGFTSRSYFSKMFKQKYNCSPKFYRKKQNSLAVTA